MTLLRFSGDVSIAPCKSVKRKAWRIVIMGPTGSGKSSFIESLTAQSLGISKDQLAGFTQEVNAYQLVNTEFVSESDSIHALPAYLIDTPGFSDTKISELEIVQKLMDWMWINNLPYINHIFYLCPITDTRVSGSKLRTKKMLQSLIMGGTTSRITIITTMWDSLSNPQAEKRAEERFSQLREDIWKDCIREGSQIFKFYNDHASALSIIAAAAEVYPGSSPLGEDTYVTSESPSAPLLYQELLNRIENSQQAIAVFQMDKLELIANPNEELESAILPSLQQVMLDLAKFLDQLVAFGRPPPGFEHTLEVVISRHLVNNIKEAHEEKRALQVALSASKVQANDTQNHDVWLKSRLEKVDARVARLSRHFDDVGQPLRLSDEKSRKKVLEMLRPKVSFMDRVHKQVGSMKKILPWR